MPKPRAKSKNRFGLTSTEILRGWFHLEQARRRKAAPALKAAREAREDARHERRITRRETTISLAETRIERIERHPSPFGVRQLALIADDRSLPSGVRLKAALLILRFADTRPGEAIPPSGPMGGPSDDTRPRPRS